MPRPGMACLAEWRLLAAGAVLSGVWSQFRGEEEAELRGELLLQVGRGRLLPGAVR